jgi:hypothetical protein
MEEQVEKFGSNRKQKRHNNKKERLNIKNLLKNYESFDDDLDEENYNQNPEQYEKVSQW